MSTSHRDMEHITRTLPHRVGGITAPHFPFTVLAPLSESSTALVFERGSNGCGVPVRDRLRRTESQYIFPFVREPFAPRRWGILGPDTGPQGVACKVTRQPLADGRVVPQPRDNQHHGATADIEANCQPLLHPTYPL